jgi:AraC family transcriptional regulator
MQTSLLLDQPDLIEPHRARRFRFGNTNGARLAILNARGARYEGGGDEPDLSLKWIPQGEAHYRSNGRTFRLRRDTQLLLNRGQAYTLEMREPSESFVVFFDRRLADAAWSARTSKDQAFAEVPSVAGQPTTALRTSLWRLRDETRSSDPSADNIIELAICLLNDVADLALEQRAMLQRVPSVRRKTREELLRRVARAETYLVDAGRHATLQGAADAAALSQFHLIRVFRAVFGETPLVWATGKRLETARDCLVLTGDAIENIARRAGYESRTAFDRAFQRRFADTPGRVRAAR